MVVQGHVSTNLRQHDVVLPCWAACNVWQLIMCLLACREWHSSTAPRLPVTIVTQTSVSAGVSLSDKQGQRQGQGRERWQGEGQGTVSTGAEWLTLTVHIRLTLLVCVAGGTPASPQSPVQLMAWADCRRRVCPLVKVARHYCNSSFEEIKAQPTFHPSPTHSCRVSA